jgi:hypothetical protein
LVLVAGWSVQEMQIVGICASGLYLLEWIVLKTWYAVSAHSKPRTEDRYDGDRAIALNTIAVVGLALLALAAELVLLNDGRSWSTASIGIPIPVVAATALLLWILPVSSLVDWYWVRPRRDGIVWQPICQLSDDLDRRKLLTRVLTWHRAAAVIWFGAGIALLCYYALSELSDGLGGDTFVGKFVQALNAPLSIVAFSLVGWSQGLLDFFRHFAGRGILRFGDFVRTNTSSGPFTGLVFEVSLEGPTVVNERGEVAHPSRGLVDPDRVNLQASSLSSHCPIPPQAGQIQICGSLDVDRKCQWGAGRLIPADPPQRPQARVVDKDHSRPAVRLSSLW